MQKLDMFELWTKTRCFGLKV